MDADLARRIREFDAAKPPAYHLRNAIHEIGHVYIYVSRGIRFREVQLDGDERFSAAVRGVEIPLFVDATGHVREEALLGLIDGLLAGTVAEWIAYHNVRGNNYDDGCDYALAGQHARLVTGPTTIGQRFLRQRKSQLRQELGDIRVQRIMAVLVEQLLLRRQLSCDECLAFAAIDGSLEATSGSARSSL